MNTKQLVTVAPFLLVSALAPIIMACNEPAPAVVAPPPPPVSPVSPPRTLDTKTLCADNAILLTQHSFESLQAGGYCKLCKKFDESACELDWPFSDVPSCKAYDEMRNGIFAFHGRTFESDEWRAFFASKPWYKPDPAFTEARLSAVARTNVAFLKRAATEKIGCAD